MRAIDADALIEMLREHAKHQWFGSVEAWMHFCDKAMFAIDYISEAPTLDVQPVDVEFTLRRALAHMWYAYVNKDSEYPHEYELEAVREAERLLGRWGDCMPIMISRDDNETD